MSAADQRRTGNFVVRPATGADVDALHRLSLEADGTLERYDGSRDGAARIIALGERSLRRENPADERAFVLVIEDPQDRQVFGTISLTCRIGLDQPFYDYRLGKIVHSSRPLKSYRCLDVLYLCNDLTGCSEIHSLYVRPAYRKQGAAVQLLKAVQLFIAGRPEEFAPRIIAELRGVVDQNGEAPFWEAVGRHFFRVDQPAAERLVAKGHKAFIAELMPKHPVYVTLLPEAAQRAIGGIHADIASWMPLLEADGFHYESHVDIFDGGRVIEARTLDLAGVAGSRVAEVAAGSLPAERRFCWLAAGQGQDFRMSGADCGDGGNGTNSLVAEAAALARLALPAGGPVRLLAG